MEALAEKRATAEEFVRRLLASEVGDRVVKVILFGSVARGDVREESDVDMLVLTLGSTDEVESVSSDIGYDLMLEDASRVQAFALPYDQADHPPALFVAYALEEGKEVFSLPEEDTIRLEIRGHIERCARLLAEAEDAAARDNHNMAVAGAYTAAEHLVKALLLDRLGYAPRDHGRLVSAFGRVFVLQEQTASGELGHELSRCLELRARALYGWTEDITSEGAERAIHLARQMRALADRELPLPEKGDKSDSDE